MSVCCVLFTNTDTLEHGIILDVNAFPMHFGKCQCPFTPFSIFRVSGFSLFMCTMFTVLLAKVKDPVV